MNVGATPKRASRTLAARAGVRLAFVNAAAILVAFGLAGCLALLSIQHFNRHDMREHVQGEAASLIDELRQKGPTRLPHTIDKRERLWRGFDYRLTGSNGAFLAGRLSADAGDGWRETNVRVADGVRPFLVLTQVLPDGGRLSVGQDLTAEQAEMAAATRSLALCGALGAAACLLLAYLFNRQAWRRVDGLIEVARQVGEGKLEVRAQVRVGDKPDDLDALARTFNAMLDRIASLLEQLRQVTVGIAHDMRTPLNRVHLKLERLQTEVGETPALSGKVDAIREDVTEALRTFDALLQLAEIGSSDDARFGRLDLANVALRVAEAFQLDIEESGRTLTTNLEPAWVRGDAGLLSQVAANLLENALRHTPPGTEIRMTTQVKADAILLAVCDNGPGVGAADHDQLVKPFVRCEQSRSKPGSGLGLSIVAAVSRLHDAKLFLRDAKPGLEVALSFPAA